MDIVENPNSVTPDKQPWNILLARLEVVLHVLEDYGIDESLWDWYPILTELIIPSLFHQNPECRIVAIENVVLLYKMVGDDIKNIIGGLKELKINIKETITNKMLEIDNINKKNNDKQLESNYLKISNNSLKNSKLKTTNNNYDSIQEEDQEHDNDDPKSKSKNITKTSGFNSGGATGKSGGNGGNYQNLNATPKINNKPSNNSVTSNLLSPNVNPNTKSSSNSLYK